MPPPSNRIITEAGTTIINIKLRGKRFYKSVKVQATLWFNFYVASIIRNKRF